MRALCVALLGLFLFSCRAPALTREERISAAMLHLEEVPIDWRISSDVSLSAKPACEGQSYWRTFRPTGSIGRYHLVQQVVFDCADAAGGDRVFRMFTRPMLRMARAAKPLLGKHPRHADDYAAYCEFNTVGGTECKVISRYGGVVSLIFSIYPTGQDEWPRDMDLQEWGIVRVDEAFRRL